MAATKGNSLSHLHAGAILIADKQPIYYQYQYTLLLERPAFPVNISAIFWIASLYPQCAQLPAIGHGFKLVTAFLIPLEAKH